MMEQGIGFLVLMRGIFDSKNEDRVRVCVRLRSVVHASSRLASKRRTRHPFFPAPAAIIAGCVGSTRLHY